MDVKTAQSYIDLLCALLLVWPGGESWAIEIKRSLNPKLERGFQAACTDLSPARKLVVYAGTEPFPLGNDVVATPLATLCQELAPGTSSA